MLRTARPLRSRGPPPAAAWPPGGTWSGGTCGTRSPAAGGRMPRGRTDAGTEPPFMMETPLLFIFMVVRNTGFGDSTGTPTEAGLTRDAICVYEWTKARSGNTPVCLWGHSLGTGVATNAARALEEKGCPVDAIVLEAPFTNMWVASINYPLLKIYQKLPRCLRTLMDALKEDKIVFPSDENVKFLSSPLLILHGEDDRTVPLECGKQLYEIARNAYRIKERVKMVIFPAGFHHNLLCESPLLLRSVRDFLTQQWA